ncbi:hypothetical protein GIB67_018163 [Kingdonia uniflora]|uniref:Protein FAR1-RELATED SEQUENCE n=1 Tax=Kingdonia uniflora TaxID=39325 RepID=A0A7J7NMJ9_9MAGN|nr:hypothetical protein GIB67_018163 [Kingdonia uniflora]
MKEINYGCEAIESMMEAYKPKLKYLFEEYQQKLCNDECDPSVVVPSLIDEENMVFPNSRYRFCLWHITNKFPVKIGHVYWEPSTFKEDMDMIMHNTYEAVKFEIMWMDLIEKHKLDDNLWMRGIFNIRHKWIPLWNRSTFFAGMSSTRRSKAINNFFNGWLSVITGLYSFVTKYETALIEVYDQESEENFTSKHRYRPVGSHQALLKDTVKIYTRTMFHKLQDHFDQVGHFIVIKRNIEGNLRQLTVKSHSGRTESFELNIDLKKLTGNYGYKLFEYVGLPCCHLLKVFSKYDILKIPEAFIMSRVSKMKEGLKFTVLKLDEIESYLDNYDESLTQTDASQPNISTSLAASMISRTIILNPLVVQAKG